MALQKDDESPGDKKQHMHKDTEPRLMISHGLLDGHYSLIRLVVTSETRTEIAAKDGVSHKGSLIWAGRRGETGNGTDGGTERSRGSGSSVRQVNLR